MRCRSSVAERAADTPTYVKYNTCAWWTHERSQRTLFQRCGLSGEPLPACMDITKNTRATRRLPCQRSQAISDPVPQDFSVPGKRPNSPGAWPSASAPGQTSIIRAGTQRNRSVPQQQLCTVDHLRQGDYWMRSVSFAGLHRILSAVADAPDGLTASEINELVLNKGVTLTPNNPRPAPTTLYHYRNTLLRLQAITRTGRTLKANVSDPHVRVDAPSCFPCSHPFPPPRQVTPSWSRSNPYSRFELPKIGPLFLSMI